ncbi:MAG: methyltransferase domain-containing protein [Devosia nanyangense]|uniref:Methyltransferase domain-containing protein n=1 Tax=Devosia nanyangense TaxID=1228055 RepID=A0A933NV07_9HYPH|nr:methyltransferase domain-containing protein [Devosia nanyangense]
MPDAHYDDPRLAVLYDLDSGWSPDRDFYLELASPPPQAILDLGCRTGLIADAYVARGHAVTGVDPSPAMLDVARKKPNGATIDWVLASAETYRSAKRFDLIIMTGHAFQVLLDDAAIAAAFATIRVHLAPGGRAVFESRNPALDWSAKWVGGDADLVHGDMTVHYSRRILSRTADLLTFEQHYAFPDETLISTSTLRFPTRAEVETLLSRAGLTAESVLGDWSGGPLDPTTSEEMIFTVSAA